MTHQEQYGMVKLAWGRRKKELRDFVPAIGLGAATAAGYKARHDVRGAMQELRDWDASLAPHRAHLAKRPDTYVPIGQAAKIIDTYNAGGRRAARRRILGIPAGKLVELYRGSGVGKHYRLFMDPKTSDDALRAHMLEKAIGQRADPKFTKDLTKATPEMMAALAGQTGDIPAMVKDMKRRFPGEPAHQFDRAVSGIRGSTDIRTSGDAFRLAGNGRNVVSVPRTYLRVANKLLKPVAKIGNPLLLAGLVGTAGMTAYPFWHKHH